MTHLSSEIAPGSEDYLLKKVKNLSTKLIKGAQFALHIHDVYIKMSENLEWWDFVM